VLLASEPAFVAMKIVGAAYLVLLGVQALWTALRGSPAARPEVRGRTRALTPLKAARQGFLSNIGNPKIAVFFTSLLPQFASGEGSTFLALLVLGAVFAAMTLAWLSAYAVVVARAGDLLRRPPIGRALDAVVGAALVALGLRVAFAHRG
jgi:threonine/homoserine/homoserine lactone efflux protein